MFVNHPFLLKIYPDMCTYPKNKPWLLNNITSTLDLPTVLFYEKIKNGKPALCQLKNYSVIKTMAGIFDTTQDEPHPQQLPRMERIVMLRLSNQ